MTTALDLAQGVKKRPAMQEMQVLSLGQEDPIEEEMATHSSILAFLEVYSTPQRNCLEANINNYTFMTLETFWSKTGLFVLFFV